MTPEELESRKNTVLNLGHFVYRLVDLARPVGYSIEEAFRELAEQRYRLVQMNNTIAVFERYER